MGAKKTIRTAICFASVAVAIMSSAKSASAQNAPIRYVFGPRSYTDSKGQVWSPVPASVISASASHHLSICTKGAAFTGTSDPGLYAQQMVEDWGDLLLNVPVPSGAYTVNLYFAEPCANTVPGNRIFGVAVNATTIVASLDLTATAGVEKPVIETAQVSNAQVALDLKPIKDAPLIAAIEILPATSSISPSPSSFQIAAKLHWDDGTAVAGTILVAQAISANPPSSKSLGSFKLDSTGAVTASLAPDLTLPLSFTFTLVNPSGATVNTLGFSCDALTLSVFPRTLSPQITLTKASATLKSFSF
ncbi:MAG: malectin domain-containing carbohydrate-binding protein [Candidatus Acidiferrales bacterium]